MPGIDAQRIFLDLSEMEAAFVEMKRLSQALSVERRAEYCKMIREKLPDADACAVVCVEEVVAVGAARVVYRVEPSVAFLDCMLALRAVEAERDGVWRIAHGHPFCVD